MGGEESICNSLCVEPDSREGNQSAFTLGRTSEGIHLEMSERS